MIPNVLKRMAKGLFRSVGLDVRRIGAQSEPTADQRAALLGVLQQARKGGFSPSAVIDVGAAYGHFAADCRSVFHDARYLLVEALEEYRPHLEAVARSLPNVELVFAAAAAAPGELTIHVHPDLVGSSLYLEDEDSNVNGVPRTIRTVTLDGLVADRRIEGPFLLKIDVQGAELDVLAGAEEVLRRTEYVLLEVSLFEFFKGGPLLHDVVAFMRQRGFVAYDLAGLQYRPLDNALSQVDIAFVKENGPLRQHQFYATREQREEQNQRFQIGYAQDVGTTK